jgi:hypothetical protein
VHYEYEVNQERFNDDFMTANRPDLVVGMEIWVLIDPLKPGKSLPWML